MVGRAPRRPLVPTFAVVGRAAVILLLVACPGKLWAQAQPTLPPSSMFTHPTTPGFDLTERPSYDDDFALRIGGQSLGYAEVPPSRANDDPANTLVRQGRPDLFQQEDQVPEPFVPTGWGMVQDEAALRTSLEEASRVGKKGTIDPACFALAQEGRSVSDFWARDPDGRDEAHPVDLGVYSDDTTGRQLDDLDQGPGFTQWCGPQPIKGWATQPFTMAVWGPLAAVTLSTVLFWSVRRFRSP